MIHRLLLRPAAKVVMVGALGMVLTACSSVFEDVQHTWRYATTKTEDAYLSPAEIASFPYTAVYIQPENQSRSLVVLAFADNEAAQASEQLTWATAESEQLITRFGRVIRSYGLPRNIRLSSDSLDNDPLQCLQQALQVNRSVSQADTCRETWQFSVDVVRNAAHSVNKKQLQHLAATAHQRYTVTSQFFPQQIVALELPRGTVQALLVHEELTTTGGRDSAQWRNTYWLALDGHVLKSNQRLAPNDKPITITQVKWVGRDDHHE